LEGGVIPVALALESMGIKNWNKPLLKGSSQKGPYSYCMLTGSPALSPHPEEAIRIVNTPENISGDNIKVVLITKAASEGLDLKNIRLNDVAGVVSIDTVDILLYQILFDRFLDKDGYRASRIGIIRADTEYVINGEGFITKCNAEKYLESDDFKYELSIYYKALGDLQESTNNGMKPILIWLSSSLSLKYLKVLGLYRYKVSKSFLEIAENTISKNLEEYGLVIGGDMTLLPDKQTIYRHKTAIDKFFEGVYNPIKYVTSSFSEAEQKANENINRFKTRNAQKDFTELLNDAPEEVVKYWTTKLQKEGWGVEGGFDSNEFGVDFSDIWENYKKMLMADIE
jgi:hypothetical protein